METMQEILSWGAIQKIWKDTYSPPWKMESSLRDHQQAEEAHSKICHRKNERMVSREASFCNSFLHWGSEGLSIPVTGDKR